MSLAPRDKEWLDRHARSRRVAASQIVREALAEYRTRHELDDASLSSILAATRGVWRHRETPLAFQRRIRREWDRRD